MYLQVVKSFLFDNVGGASATCRSRHQLDQATLWALRTNFPLICLTNLSHPAILRRVNWLECIRLCTSVVAVMLDKLQVHLTRPCNHHRPQSIPSRAIKHRSLLSLLPPPTGFLSRNTKSRIKEGHRKSKTTSTIKSRDSRHISGVLSVFSHLLVA